MTAPPSPPAGWYPDPAGGPGQRWWDGGAWTDQVNVPPAPDTNAAASPHQLNVGDFLRRVRPAFGADAPSRPSTIAVGPAFVRKLSRRQWTMLAGVLFAAYLVARTARPFVDAPLRAVLVVTLLPAAAIVGVLAWDAYASSKIDVGAGSAASRWWGGWDVAGRRLLAAVGIGALVVAGLAWRFPGLSDASTCGSWNRATSVDQHRYLSKAGAEDNYEMVDGLCQVSVSWGTDDSLGEAVDAVCGRRYCERHEVH